MAVVVAGFLSLAATVGLFLLRPALVAYGLVAFGLLVAVGWFRYQAAIARLVTLAATASTVLTIGFITYFLFASA